MKPLLSTTIYHLMKTVFTQWLKRLISSANKVVYICFLNYLLLSCRTIDPLLMVSHVISLRSLAVMSVLLFVTPD